MNIKAKRLFVDLTLFSLKGNILDISSDNAGIIYNITKHNNENVDVSEVILNKDVSYQSCAIFFVCSLISKIELEAMFDDIANSLSDDGEIYIWDRVKVKGEIVRDDIYALLPNNVTKSFNYMNLNPFIEFNIGNLEKVLEKKFDIKETIIWDKIIYLKVKKKGTVKDESIVSRDKLKIYT